MTSVNLAPIVSDFRNKPFDPAPIRELYEAQGLTPPDNLNQDRVQYRQAYISAYCASRILANHLYLLVAVIKQEHEKICEEFGDKREAINQIEKLDAKVSQTMNSVRRASDGEGYGIDLCNTLKLNHQETLDQFIPQVPLLHWDNKKYSWNEISALLARNINTVTFNGNGQIPVDEKFHSSIFYGSHIIQAFITQLEGLESNGRKLIAESSDYIVSSIIDKLEDSLDIIPKIISAFEDFRDLYAVSFGKTFRDAGVPLTR